MGLNVSRFVEIRISNKTKNITLENPRTHFYSGHSLNELSSVTPGDSSTFRFTNNTLFWGCNGVLAFEAGSVTLAIYFSNPIDYNRFSVEMGLELSLDRVHVGDLKMTYDRLVKVARDPSDKNIVVLPTAILKEPQEKAQLSAGPIKVTATVSRGRSAVVSVVVQQQGTLRRKVETETAGIESPWPGRHVLELSLGRHYQEK